MRYPETKTKNINISKKPKKGVKQLHRYMPKFRLSKDNYVALHVSQMAINCVYTMGCDHIM